MGLQAGQGKIHPLINLVLTQLLHPLQDWGLQTFKKSHVPKKQKCSAPRKSHQCSRMGIQTFIKEMLKVLGFVSSTKYLLTRQLPQYC